MNAQELAGLDIKVCRKDSPRLVDSEYEELLQALPEWEVNHRGNMPMLERIYGFRNFADALAFTVRVGELAEAADHHPELKTEWGKVRVRWWTHSIGGLHRNDFVMAARCDGVFQQL